MKRIFAFIALLTLLLGGFSNVVAQDSTITVAVVTPYLAQPGTQFEVEAFQAAAEANGWTVNVIDTAGDMAAVNSRVQDAITQNVSAIVINSDPSQIPALKDAVAAKIPVFGLDAGSAPEVIVNVTSNGYEMAATTASYVVDRLNGKGTSSCLASMPIRLCRSAALLPAPSSTTPLILRCLISSSRM